jgi:hypothetical protein
MSKSRRAVTLALGGILAPLFAMGIASPAHAWTWNRGVTVYNGADFCVRGDAGIDHVIPGAFSGNLAYADAFALTAGCGGGLANRSAAVRLEVYHWTGSAWAICRSTDWQYGTTGVNQWGPTGPEQVLNYGGSASCGSGLYGTVGYAFVWDGAAWRGGSVWSGAEQVP